MTGLPRDALRELVREALRDALPELVADLRADRLPDGRPDGGPRLVTLRDDTDLARFVAEVVRLADDPHDGPRLRSGELRFRLAPTPAPPGEAAPPGAVPSGPVRAAVAPGAAEQRIERGPVTERHVRAAEAAGTRLVLGPAAVLTPMARDRARSAGVEVVRESRRQA